MKFKRFLSALTTLVLGCSLCPVALGAPAPAATQIQGLQTENSITPFLGMETAPRFSWHMVSDIVGQKQTAYQVLVSVDAACETGDLWDSGKIENDASLYIAYEGTVLAPRTRYFWRVIVWDKDGNEVESDVTWFETTLRQEDFEAKFIAAAAQDASEGSLPMFRTVFETLPNQAIASARLYATALGVYDAWLNGAQVAPGEMMSPGWTDYTQLLMYQTYDVTEQLKPGANALGAATGSGWYAGHIGSNPERYGQYPAFFAQLEITYEDGTMQRIATDDSWLVTCNGPYELADNERGETYDAGKELPGWATAQYDGDGWKAAQIVTAENAGETLRSIDHKTPHPVNPDDVKLVAHVGPRVKLGTEPGYDIRETELVYTLDDPDNPGGKRYILDCGQNIAGVAKIIVRGGEAGTQIRLRHAEMLYDGQEKPEGEPYLEALRSATATDYYTKKGSGDETYQPRFTFHGFRYIEVSGYPGELDPADVTAIFAGSELTQTGRIETSDADLNQLFQNVIWGQRDNFLSIPTDCPQRDERLGWTGDIAAFCDTAVYNNDVREFLRKFLTDMVQSQRADGGVSDVSPNGANELAYGNAAWADAAWVLPWSIYCAYGDETFLRDYYNMMQGQVFYYTSFAASNTRNATSGNPDGPDFNYESPQQPEITDLGTKRDDNKYIVPDCAYGDWVAPQGTPKNVISTAYFAKAAQITSEAAKILGKTEDAKYYAALSDRVKKSFQRVFWDKDTGLIEGNSQTTYLLALEFDLLPDEAARKQAGEHLVQQIAGADYHLSTGFIGAGFLLPVLSDMGYDDLAYRLLLTDSYPSWVYSIRNGATTTWERWDAYTKDGGFGDAGMNSFNHFAFGSVMEWVYGYGAGIRWDAAAPGGKHLTLRPTTGGGVNMMKTALDSVYGTIQSDWSVADNRLSYAITVPANTTATVLLPAEAEDGILANGKPTAEYAQETDGIRYIGYDAETKRAEFAVLSGSFTFESAANMTYKVRIYNETKGVVAFADISIDGEEAQTMRLPADIPMKSGQSLSFTVKPANTMDFAFESLREEDTSLPGDTIELNDIKDNRIFHASFAQTAQQKSLLEGLENPMRSAWNMYKDSSYWTKEALTDGILAAQDGLFGYSSKHHRSATPFFLVRPRLTFDLGEKTAFNQVKIYPRTDVLAADGTSGNFPASFVIEVSNGGVFWKKLVVEKNYDAPVLSPAIFDLGAQNYRYIRLRVLKLGAPVRDESDVHRLQLVEFGVYNIDAEK